jgi:hypothetical protein
MVIVVVVVVIANMGSEEEEGEDAILGRFVCLCDRVSRRFTSSSIQRL